MLAKSYSMQIPSCLHDLEFKFTDKDFFFSCGEQARVEATITVVSIVIDDRKKINFSKIKYNLD